LKKIIKSFYIAGLISVCVLPETFKSDIIVPTKEQFRKSYFQSFAAISGIIINATGILSSMAMFLQNLFLSPNSSRKSRLLIIVNLLMIS
jgi:hypothetical protein